MPVLQLKTPLSVGNSYLNQLTFRDASIAADYLSFDQKGGVAQRIALIASMSGTEEVLIKRLSGVDYRAASKIVDEILDKDEAFDEGMDAEKKSQESS